MFGMGRFVMGVAVSVFFTILVIVLFKRVTAKYQVPFVSSVVQEV